VRLACLRLARHKVAESSSMFPRRAFSRFAVDEFIYLKSAYDALRYSYSLRSSFSEGLKYESLTLPRECPMSISTAAGLTPASSAFVLKYLRKP
jgi:hypothetical protein